MKTKLSFRSAFSVRRALHAYQLKIRRENHAEFEVAPTGVDPVTFRFSVERSTN